MDCADVEVRRHLQAYRGATSVEKSIFLKSFENPGVRLHRHHPIGIAEDLSRFDTPVAGVGAEIEEGVVFLQQAPQDEVDIPFVVKVIV